MSDSRSRLLSVVQSATTLDPAETPAAGLLLEPGLADVVALQGRKAAEVSDGDEESFFRTPLPSTSGRGMLPAWRRPRWTD